MSNSYLLLREFIDDVGQAKAAQVMRVSPAMVSHLYTGRRRLTPERAHLIHQHCNGVRYTRDALLFGGDNRCSA